MTMTPSTRKALEMCRDAVVENDKWHKDHDKYDGYDESDICVTNMAAIESARLALSAPETAQEARFVWRNTMSIRKALEMCRKELISYYKKPDVPMVGSTWQAIEAARLALSAPEAAQEVGYQKFDRHGNYLGLTDCRIPGLSITLRPVYTHPSPAQPPTEAMVEEYLETEPWDVAAEQWEKDLVVRDLYRFAAHLRATAGKETP